MIKTTQDKPSQGEAAADAEIQRSEITNGTNTAADLTGVSFELPQPEPISDMDRAKMDSLGSDLVRTLVSLRTTPHLESYERDSIEVMRVFLIAPFTHALNILADKGFAVEKPKPEIHYVEDHTNFEYAITQVDG